MAIKKGSARHLGALARRRRHHLPYLGARRRRTPRPCRRSEGCPLKTRLALSDLSDDTVRFDLAPWRSPSACAEEMLKINRAHGLFPIIPARLDLRRRRAPKGSFFLKKGRRAVSTRWLGDDATFAAPAEPGSTAPPVRAMISL